MLESNKLKRPLANITKYVDKVHLKSLGKFLKLLFQLLGLVFFLSQTDQQGSNPSSATYRVTLNKIRNLKPQIPRP